MRTFFLALAVLLLFPMNSFAGMEGRYDLDAKQMLKNMTPMLKKRVPPSRLPMVLKSLSSRIGAVKSWFVLSEGGVFQGFSQAKGATKGELKATGKWSMQKGTLVINSVTIKDKQKQQLACTKGKEHLLCKPTGKLKGPQPNFRIPFRKKS